ncbi:Ribosomal L32p family protein [Babesia bovis T2Bo]|uniref:Ribosomal L32p family protein n=1 Tax=Babesia bovis T2Bo TaxID=484906 RepID=UPI001D5A1B1B|nr:Ribosomal L32p family protein [Babesia bovis T2Bo]KAG6439914.1 Ribosomal L32p family protein [Babesia bovis T2Bo]
MVFKICQVIIGLWMYISVRVPGISYHKNNVSAICLKSTITRVPTFIATRYTYGNTIENRIFQLNAVPKKKPSKRRTRIRKTAWMKRFPNNWKRPMMLDILDITKYTDGTLTKSRTTRENWLNLPNTSLDGEHFLTREIRPTW